MFTSIINFFKSIIDGIVGIYDFIKEWYLGLAAVAFVLSLAACAGALLTYIVWGVAELAHIPWYVQAWSWVTNLV